MSITLSRAARRSAVWAAACATALLWSGAAAAAVVSFSGSQSNTDAASGPSAARCGAQFTVNIGNGPGATSTGTSNLGSFLTTQSHCITLPPPAPYGQGLFVYDFGSGDLLSGTYTGVLSFNSPGLFDNVQDFQVTGGTGRFAGATGAFVGVGTVDFRGPTPSAQLNFNGAINAPAIPEPASWTLLILGVAGAGAALRRARRPWAHLA